jgi:murein DD-endopeptidase MepM/ murein hydrolase activator NlpD
VCARSATLPAAPPRRRSRRPLDSPPPPRPPAPPGPAAHQKRLAHTKKWQDNNSLDFLAPPGTPVYALVDGVVCDPAKNSACV